MDFPLLTQEISGLRFDVFPDFCRLTDEVGNILAEYARCHIRETAPDEAPEGSAVLARDNGMEPRILITPDCDIAAILPYLRAMKPADTSHLQQSEIGCGAAVVAHLRGIPVGDAMHRLYPSGRVYKIGTRRLAKITGTNRVDCGGGWPEAMDLHAVAALIRNPHRKIQQHYISIDPGPVITDPELVLRYRLEEYPRREWEPRVVFTRPKQPL